MSSPSTNEQKNESKKSPVDAKDDKGKVKAERTPENMAILDRINEDTDYRKSDKVTDDLVLELLAQHEMDEEATEDAIRDIMYG